MTFGFYKRHINRLGRVALVLLLAIGCARREAYQLLDLAHRLEGAGYEEQALSTYLEASEAAPSDAYLQRVLGRAYVRRGELDRGREALERAVELEGAYLDAYEDLIGVALADEDTDAALGWLERAARSVPNYAPIYERLVTFYAVKDRTDDAMALLNQLEQHFPEEAWIPFKKGALLRQQSQFEAALKAYEDAGNLDETLPDLWAEVGNLHFDLEHYDDAEEAFTRAIEQDPYDHRSMNNLAWTFAVRGRNLDVGIELSRTSIELREEPSYMDTLAELYYKQGDRRRALIWIRRAIRMGTDSPELKDHLKKQVERFQRAPYGRI